MKVSRKREGGGRKVGLGVEGRWGGEEGRWGGEEGKWGGEEGRWV